MLTCCGCVPQTFVTRGWRSSRRFVTAALPPANAHPWIPMSAGHDDMTTNASLPIC